MKKETFEFVTNAIDRYGERFFDFDDLFEDDEKDRYYYPYCSYHGRGYVNTDGIVIKNEIAVWLCCMQAIRDNDNPDTDLNGIMEDIRRIERDKMGKDSIILY